MAALDQTIVSTAAPTIAADLHNAIGYTWIGGAYLLANAATGPIWLKCSDIWGRKPAVLASIALFAAASVLTATATGMAMLLAGRALQGAAGGGVMSLVYVIIADLFSVRRRALYFGAMGSVWMVAGTAGPLVGGALAQHASWRWCFWINLPFCGAAFAALAAFLDVHDPRTSLRDGLAAVDWFGGVSMLAVALLLLLGLDFGGVEYPWDSPRVICMIVFGALMIGFFLYSEKRLARYPLMLLSIFTESLSGNAIIVVAFTSSMASFGGEYYLPLYFQGVKQASPLKSGLLMLPLIITCATGEILTGVFVHRVGRYRELIWAGTCLLALGSGLLILLGTASTLGDIVGFEIVFGLGFALLLLTPRLALQNSVRQADTATASATLSFLANLAKSLSTVLGGVVFQNGMSARAGELAAAGLAGDDLRALSGYNAAANVGLAAQLADPAQRRAVEEAFAGSVRNMFVMYTGIAAVGVVASVFVKQRHMSKEHTETKTGLKNMTEQKV